MLRNHIYQKNTAIICAYVALATLVVGILANDFKSRESDALPDLPPPQPLTGFVAPY